MNHPERIITEIYAAGKKLTPTGWAAVFTLAAILFSGLAYYAARPN